MFLPEKRKTFLSYLQIALYGGAVLSAAVIGARAGLSHYYASRIVDSTSPDEMAAAAFYFDRDNPDAYKNRGIVALREKDFSVAVVNFERAIELRERDFRVWLGLGHALTGLSDLDGAVNAYKTSIKFAADYAVPNRYTGLRSLDAGSTDEAFVYLSKAAAQDASLYTEVLSLVRKHYPDDPEAIGRVLVPVTREDQILTARYVIDNGFMTESVMGFLTGVELDEREKDDFIRRLIAKRDPRTARQVWLTKTVPASAMPTDGEAIFDGGFEVTTSSDDSGFGWHIEQKVSNTAIAIDGNLSHSGSRALQIKFGGNVDAGRQFISQLVLLEPFKTYQMTFAVRSSELTSGGLPVVVVTAGDPSSPRATSAVIKATNGNWVTMSVDFRTNEEATVSIGLQRANCDMDPCPIFGEMWLDDVSIKEVGHIK